MTAIIVSDVHLRDGTSVKTTLFVRFLQEVASQFKKIYLLGDVFDVWPGTNSFLIRIYRPVLQALKNLVEDGHEVHFLEGNHDFRLGNYFQEQLGVIVHTDLIEETWNGKKIFMAHGDLGNPRDLGYKALRYVLRHDLTHTVLKALPEDYIYKMGAKTSQLSRKYQKNSEKIETQIRQTYRQTAEKIFRTGQDVVIMGHTHLPDDVTTLIGNRSCRYINTGDWVTHFTYLEFDGTQFYTKTHPLKTL